MNHNPNRLSNSPATNRVVHDCTANMLAFAQPKLKPRRVIVFSGHMIDANGRATPRFPQSKELPVRDCIATQLEAWQVGKGDMAISSAARGGDILFAETCAQRGAEVWLFLPRREKEFLDESVRVPGTDWEERFHVLLAHSRVRRFFQADCLREDSEGLSVHARNNLWILECARALAPSPDCILAVVVWDGQPMGDGPGGTSDFIVRMKDMGGEIAPIINPLKPGTQKRKP